MPKPEYRAYTDDWPCIIACLREYVSGRNSLEGLSKDQLIFIAKNYLNWHPLTQSGDG